MKRKASIFGVVQVICSLSLIGDLLINYNFCIPQTVHQRHLALVLPLDIPLGVRQKKLINCIS